MDSAATTTAVPGSRYIAPYAPPRRQSAVAIYTTVADADTAVLPAKHAYSTWGGRGGVAHDVQSYNGVQIIEETPSHRPFPSSPRVLVDKGLMSTRK